MSGETPNLGLQYLEPSQAQPEVKVNDAWDKIDAGSGGVAVSDATTSPPIVARARELKFMGATVTHETDGVALVQIDSSSGGGSGGGGSPLTVTDGITSVADVTEVLFVNRVAVSDAGGGAVHLTIDPASGGGSGATLSDGVTTYTDVAEIIFPGALITALGGGVYQVEFTALSEAPHLYWRVNITSSAFGGNTGFAEISMASSVGGSNQCSGGTATAIGHDSSYEPDKALDSNASTSWNYASSTGWWRYQFATAVQVLEVKITARLDAPTTSPTTWDLQYSDDGTTFTTLKSFTAATWTTGATQTFEYP